MFAYWPSGAETEGSRTGYRGRTTRCRSPVSAGENGHWKGGGLFMSGEPDRHAFGTRLEPDRGKKWWEPGSNNPKKSISRHKLSIASVPVLI